MSASNNAAGGDSIVQDSPAAAQASVHPQQVVQPFRSGYNASEGGAIFRPSSASPPPFHSGGATSAGDVSFTSQMFQQQKKRGRPRKYGPEGSASLTLNGTAFSPPPAAPTPQSVNPPPSSGTLSPPLAAPPSQPSVQVQAHSSPPSSAVGLASAPPAKRRGRPPGSGSGSGIGKKQRQQQQQQQLLLQQEEQIDALGLTGYGLTPHVVVVQPGEDLMSKIMCFTTNGPRDICIISANGIISSVTLRQPATSGGTATFEGRFEILSLSGSFLLTEVGGQRTRSGGLSVTLTGPDGRLLGGSVAGLLIAATPVQVIVCSFVAKNRKEPRPVNHVDPFANTPRVDPAGGNSPPSRGTLSGSSGEPASPLSPTIGYLHNNGEGISSMPLR